MKSILRFTSLALFGVLFAGMAHNAFPQAYPNKPVRIIVPFPAGGSADTLARTIGQKLTESFGQQVLIDNRPGAGGNIGTDAAAKSAPDGYTLLMTPSSIISNPSLYSKLSYDPMKDLMPVTEVAWTPNILVVHPSVPANSVKELIALAKSKPGQLSYASGGNGATNHLAGELFKSMTGIDMVHIPYKGNPVAVLDVLNGQVGVMFDFMITSLPHVKAGKLRALAVTGAKRSPQLPDLPTVAEAGVPGFEAGTWFAVLAPAGTPAAIVKQLNNEIVKILNLPDVKERLYQLGAEPRSGTPEQLATLMKQDMAKWAKVIKDANIHID